VKALKAQLPPAAENSIAFIPLDLSDLRSVDSFVHNLCKNGWNNIDIVIENAGVWPRKHSTTAQANTHIHIHIPSFRPFPCLQDDKIIE
jgi:NADP-dependent 3-hydroxy acid dehydrogenase YdfG